MARRGQPRLGPGKPDLTRSNTAGTGNGGPAPVTVPGPAAQGSNIPER